MALVYRAPKLNDNIYIQKVGPGYYDREPQSNNKKHVNQSSFFVSKTNRDPFQIKKQEITNSKQNNQEKAEASQQTNFKISQKNSPVFKSKVQRFKQQKKPFDNLKQHENKLTEDFKQLLKKEGPNITQGKILKLKDKKAIQEILNQKYQHFPSIPDWQKSYGYKIDPQSKRLVSNENPNVLLLLKQQIVQKEKINCTLGPGYYFVKNQSSNKSLPWKEQKEAQLPSLNKGPIIQSVSNSHKYNTIQGNLCKLKSQLKNVNNIQASHSQIQKFNHLAEENRKKLIISKMLKNYGEFIDQIDKKQPQKMLQKFALNKKIIQKYNQNQFHKRNNSKEKSTKHFLAKIERFKNEINKNISQQKQVKSQAEIVSPKLSHNIKQTYEVGQIRFKQSFKENLGPASYKQQLNSIFFKPKGTIKQNSKRFDNQLQKEDSPGPGSYNLHNKKERLNLKVLQQIKQEKNQKRKTSAQQLYKKQDSMESLYQNWGRQMNYLIKKQSKVKEIDTKSQIISSQINQTVKDITQTRNILQKQAKVYGLQICKQSIKKSEKHYNKLPKGKHLYNYKSPQQQKVQAGPGNYEICKDLNKKTFNVTYN